MKDMCLFNEGNTSEAFTDFSVQYVQDSLIQIWGRFLGYPVNYTTLNIIKDEWKAIYHFSKEAFEKSSPNDFNTVIDFVVSAIDKEYGVYRPLIYDTVKSHEVV